MKIQTVNFHQLSLSESVAILNKLPFTLIKDPSDALIDQIQLLIDSETVHLDVPFIHNSNIYKLTH